MHIRYASTGCDLVTVNTDLLTAQCELPQPSGGQPQRVWPQPGQELGGRGRPVLHGHGSLQGYHGGRQEVPQDCGSSHAARSRRA